MYLSGYLIARVRLIREFQCDEARPSCYQCRRGGRKCPGYARGLKFVNENTKLQGEANTVPKPCIRINSRSMEQKGIVASFIQDIFPIGQSVLQLSFIGSWLWHVPEALHKNHAMDLAAESLALAYFAKTTKSMETLMRSRWVYAKALRSLSAALQDSKSRFASEILCATLLFVHYEV
jgi:hypothetical protein